MSEIKTNLIIAVRGYKIVKKQRNGNFTDTTVIDNANNKVLLRAIEPLTIEHIGVNEVKNVTDFMKCECYDSAILISRHFTDNALAEMGKQRIQYISEDHMPPFDIQDLYLAIVNCANSFCQEKCRKASQTIPECIEKAVCTCRTKTLVVSAKQHFEDGSVGLLKNDLRVALTLVH